MKGVPFDALHTASQGIRALLSVRQSINGDKELFLDKFYPLRIPSEKADLDKEYMLYKDCPFHWWGRHNLNEQLRLLDIAIQHYALGA